ncbi:MAG: tRNA preQ1(34) S-adenosylmethionine ribosyltransferase-isomerase QueA [Gemmatimonadota bacterium]
MHPLLHRTSAFDFELPESSIAQSPCDRRDASRLMILDRATGSIRHGTFADLADLVPAGDVLVRNTTRVFRARLLGVRDSGAPAEVMLLKSLGDRRWEAMVKPGAKLKTGRLVHIAPGFDVRILDATGRGTRVVQLVADDEDTALLERHGHIPLPPYISRSDRPDDAERYQTVYARESGSVAAPTAGLHFTPELLATLTSRGVQLADVLLHVGAGTFKPVEVEDFTTHRLHEEWHRLDDETATRLNDAHARGAHLWAVGTTSVRTLESRAAADGRLVPGEGETAIFIHPPYTFRAVDRLVTNFHLPRSSLLMLVAAFAGYEFIMDAYRTAVRMGYRFYSYGDAMVIQ